MRHLSFFVSLQSPFAGGTAKDAKIAKFSLFRVFRDFPQLRFLREISRMQLTAKGLPFF